jgi:hypothetical protein
MRGNCKHSRSLAWLLLALAAAWPLPGSAQTCSADVQCANGGRSFFYCIGETLVVKRSVCSGTCREIEERRQNCGSRMIGVTCEGNVAVRTGGGCNASLGVCAPPRGDRQPCAPSCVCRGNRLAVASGACTPGVGCARTVQVCRNGCSCSPQPRCR